MIPISFGAKADAPLARCVGTFEQSGAVQVEFGSLLATKSRSGVRVAIRRSISLRGSTLEGPFGRQVAVSPDGRTVALLVGTKGVWNVLVASADGSRKDRTYSTGPVARMAWSPDGVSLAALKIDGRDRSHLGIVGDSRRGRVLEDAERFFWAASGWTIVASRWLDRGSRLSWRRSRSLLPSGEVGIAPHRPARRSLVRFDPRTGAESPVSVREAGRLLLGASRVPTRWIERLFLPTTNVADAVAGRFLLMGVTDRSVGGAGVETTDVLLGRTVRRIVYRINGEMAPILAASVDRAGRVAYVTSVPLGPLSEVPPQVLFLNRYDPVTLRMRQFSIAGSYAGYVLR